MFCRTSILTLWSQDKSGCQETPPPHPFPPFEIALHLDSFLLIDDGNRMLFYSTTFVSDVRKSISTTFVSDLLQVHLSKLYIRPFDNELVFLLSSYPPHIAHNPASYIKNSIIKWIVYRIKWVIIKAVFLLNIFHHCYFIPWRSDYHPNCSMKDRRHLQGMGRLHNMKCGVFFFLFFVLMF